VSFQPPASGPPPPQGARRSPGRGGAGLVLPLLLIAGGLLALLLNFGVISANQLVRAFDLWPAALILLGVLLIFRVWLRIGLPYNAELMQVVVLPPHDDLQSEMELRQGHL